tara:strand:- start:549 stop:704 length:156 start_codon:yes stop_codon:yes gene_type:complete
MDNKYGLGSSKVAVELHKKKKLCHVDLAKVQNFIFAPPCKTTNVRNVVNDK